MSARSLITLTFNLQPDIKSSFQRFKSEEARYDFFYVSRDSLTPRLKLSNTFDEYRDATVVTRQRDHDVELSVEKRFFDTTELNVAVGYATEEVDDEIGNHPFLSADLRYPLWASREKLERASEDIFRQNELNDAQLSYIQQVRSRLQSVLFKFYEVAQQLRLVGYYQAWLNDLTTLQDQMGNAIGHDFAVDERRLDAEIAKVGANLRIAEGWYGIQVERLKAVVGLPFHASIELLENSFNPFAGMTHREVLQASIETDPEIATLRNAVRNAEVQLELARRGRWDVALQLGGESSLEGRGDDEGSSDWSVSAGLDVSAVDPRVTDSLVRQAQANIHRFSQAIVARENAIFVDTLEPLVRIDTLGQSRQELIDNFSRYESDYHTGISAYLAGELNIDDLLKRRENVFEQQEEISRLTFLVGANVAELCAATGKFFEFLDGDAPNTTG